MAEARAYRLPGDIRDEMLIAILYLALAESHLHADVPNVLIATDAIPSAYGSCVAPRPRPVVRELFRPHKHGGGAGRLDWQDKQAEWCPTQMPRTDDITNRLFKTLEWKPRLSGKFERTAHLLAGGQGAEVRMRFGDYALRRPPHAGHIADSLWDRTPGSLLGRLEREVE